jgi:hypothetical protein
LLQLALSKQLSQKFRANNARGCWTPCWPLWQLTQTANAPCCAATNSQARLLRGEEEDARRRREHDAAVAEQRAAAVEKRRQRELEKRAVEDAEDARRRDMARKEHELELKLLSEEGKRARERAREAAAEEEARHTRLEHQRQVTEDLIRVRMY